MPRLFRWILLGAVLAVPGARAAGQEAPRHARVDPQTVALILARHEEGLAPLSRQGVSLLAFSEIPAPYLLGTGQPWRMGMPQTGDADSLSAPLSRRWIVEENEASDRTIRGGPLLRCWNAVVDETRHNVWRLGQDFRHLYTGENLGYLALAIGVAAPLAYSRIDQDVSDFYQAHIRSKRTDEWALAGYQLGSHKITIPIYLGVMAAGMYWEDTPTGGLAYTWSNRTIRALAVGGPAVGILQYGLGAGRPGEGDSRWHPFRDNNTVAGHGFVGAMPFLAAASMTDNVPLKTVFFAGSLWTTWARLNDDAHFVSQCILGWSIAYLSMRSVTRTDWTERRLELVPIEERNGVGVGIYLRY